MSDKADNFSDHKKKSLILHVLKFLRQEMLVSSPDKRESIEVTIQCLESAYSIDYATEEAEIDKFDEFMALFTHLQITPANLAGAEEFKGRGNECMRNSNFKEAIDNYTRAIGLNPDNAVYYCNRAAAYSRLENHHLALQDCKQAVQLDPTYGKAYGRLGIAYSHLNMFPDARDAYRKALTLDPTNSTYSDNLKLAQEQISHAEETPGIAGINEFMANPNLLNVASQMLNDPGVRNVMSGILNMGEEGGNPNIDALLQMGQQLATQMQINNPAFVNNLRRQFIDAQQPGADNSNNEDQNEGGNGNPPNNGGNENSRDGSGDA